MANILRNNWRKWWNVTTYTYSSRVKILISEINVTRFAPVLILTSSDKPKEVFHTSFVQTAVTILNLDDHSAFDAQLTSGFLSGRRPLQWGPTQFQGRLNECEINIT